MTRHDDRPAPSRRIAALISLVALAAAIAVAVTGAIYDPWFVVSSIACLAVLALGGWYAVSQANWVRWAAIAVGGASLVALVAVTFSVDVRWWRVAVALAAIAVSVGAARRALTRPEDAATPRTAAPAPRRGVLLMNPKSGGGKVGRFHLVDECRARGIEPVVLEPGDDLLQLAKEVIAGGADVIGMAGGDGSQALVASVAIEHDVPVVVIPAGTRNHFALDLGLDRDDVVGALDAYADGVEDRIDLATVNGRVFVNNASLGLYARIVQSPGYRDAKVQTAASMLPDMLGPNAEPFDLRFTGPDGTEHPSAHLVLVSNNPYRLQTLVGAGSRGRLDGGVLGILATSIRSPAQLERFLALEAMGQVGRFDGWIEWQSETFEIRSDGGVEIGIDGEALVMEAPLVFRSMRSVLRIRRSRTALRRRKPDTRVPVLTRSSLAKLARIATGRESADR